jgi:hypothetical protein
MASTQSWTEYNGSGATATAARAEANWKRVDDSSTAYSSSPINSSNNENSMAKIQAIVFAGTYNSLSALTYKSSSNAPATGLSIVGAVLTSYTQPAVTATGDSAMSTTGLAANFNNSTTPFGAGTSTYTTGGTVYANALRTQLQTTSSYAGGPGDISTITHTASWTES